VKVEMEVKDEDEFEDALEPEGCEERDLRTEEMTRSATSPRPVARAEAGMMTTTRECATGTDGDDTSSGSMSPPTTVAGASRGEKPMEVLSDSQEAVPRNGKLACAEVTLTINNHSPSSGPGSWEWAQTGVTLLGMLFLCSRVAMSTGVGAGNLVGSDQDTDEPLHPDVVDEEGGDPESADLWTRTLQVVEMVKAVMALLAFGKSAWDPAK
jgi:hypothetical protein